MALPLALGRREALLGITSERHVRLIVGCIIPSQAFHVEPQSSNWLVGEARARFSASQHPGCWKCLLPLRRHGRGCGIGVDPGDGEAG